LVLALGRQTVYISTTWLHISGSDGISGNYQC